MMSSGVTSAGATGNGIPTAFSYTKYVLTPGVHVVELPAAFPQDLTSVTCTLDGAPVTPCSSPLTLTSARSVSLSCDIVMRP